MMLWADIRLRINRWFREHQNIIIAVLFIWLIILIINNVLKSQPARNTLDTSYSPHESVIGSAQTVPTQLEEPINQIIDTYFNYCQNKNYEAAYDMLLEDCKKVYFPTLTDFKEYIDVVFNEEKTYYIQNYSNYKNYYIYQIRIFENIMKTGLTGKSDISFYEEKMSIHNENGQLKLGLRQYISSEEMDDIYEDNYLKIWIEQKDTFYEQENYTVKIRNKSDKMAVLADGQENQEIILKVGSYTRDTVGSNLSIVLQPGEERTYGISFTKFYDETYLSSGIIFNTVRILNSYSGMEFTKELELKNAEKLYSINIPF